MDLICIYKQHGCRQLLHPVLGIDNISNLEDPSRDGARKWSGKGLLHVKRFNNLSKTNFHIAHQGRVECMRN